MAELNTQIQDEMPVLEQTDYIKCDGCGSNMAFDPVTQKLKCPHCGNVVDFNEDSAVKELSIEKAFDEATKWNDNASLFVCDNCGSRVVLKSTEVAKACPYCGTTHIVKSDLLAGIRPNAVYPFLLNKEQAKEKFLKWAKSRFFAPKVFKKNVTVDNINGVYEPCFTFDTQTTSTYSGKLGETRTRTVRRNGKTVTETYTYWYTVSGVLSHFFDDVTISSGGSLDQKTMKKIMPFAQNTLKVYSEEFLSGFMANHYQKDLRQCWGEAKTEIDAQIRRLIINKYHADTVAYLNVSTMHGDVRYKYVLLPTYVVNFNYKHKVYNVCINGQTGKMTGKSPISIIKAGIVAILALVAVIGIICLVSLKL